MSLRLIATSEAARRAIDGEFLTINRLPFRVEREHVNFAGTAASP